MILLTDAIFLFVPSHHDVAQDVFREADGPLELARLVRRQRELEDAIVAVTVVRDLVGETAALWRRSLTAARRSSSAVGGMRYMSSYGRIKIDSVLSLGLPRVVPGRKGAAALVRDGNENCT
jgi:hypothetical protein